MIESVNRIKCRTCGTDRNDDGTRCKVCGLYENIWIVAETRATCVCGVTFERTEEGWLLKCKNCGKWPRMRDVRYEEKETVEVTAMPRRWGW